MNDAKNLRLHSFITPSLCMRCCEQKGTKKQLKCDPCKDSVHYIIAIRTASTPGQNKSRWIMHAILVLNWSFV